MCIRNALLKFLPLFVIVTQGDVFANPLNDVPVVFSDADHCEKKSRVALAKWRGKPPKQGPPGLLGPPGCMGPGGPVGATGYSWEDEGGPTGPTGTSGEVGATGLTGVTGA